MAELFHIDAFASEMFHGNPAAVCLLKSEVEAIWMQAFAEEMNLSETAFVWREKDAWRLRWFTPLVEVKLCGHATLATAHALWQAGWAKPGETLRFQTLSGLLESRQSAGGMTLNFPSDSVTAVPVSKDLIAALGLKSTPHFVGQSHHTSFALVEIGSADELRRLTPNFAALVGLHPPDVIVTASGEAPYDFYSRFFAPGLGINEDPVTGAAHCILAPYWAPKLGKTKFRARQLSKRGGDMEAELIDGRVNLVGQALTVFRTEIKVPGERA